MHDHNLSALETNYHIPKYYYSFDDLEQRVFRRDLVMVFRLT